ncbi:hypothetical protein JW711_05550 [Candidatus Woesearchaeota archaeon]|nr:hypothetical protein [Candidatus Woesearchaeota archaeon]
MADFVDVDQAAEIGNYIHVIDSRARLLEKDVLLHDKRLDEYDQKLRTIKKMSKAEYSEMQDAVSAMKDDVRLVQRSIISMISVLKNTVKGADFDRFQKRLDLWAPETFVSRKEAQRVVEDLKIKA